MSDFHFSQDGRPIQLRHGVNAAIKMDLVTPYLSVEGSVESTNALAGTVIPLWHYDAEEMIWKEEGESTISADNLSTSGFSASGEVTHVCMWDLDGVVPQIIATVEMDIVVDNVVV